MSALIIAQNPLIKKDAATGATNPAIEAKLKELGYGG